MSSQDVFSDRWQKMMERRAGRSQANAALGERGLEHLAKRVYTPGFTARSDSGFCTSVPASLLSPMPATVPQWRAMLSLSWGQGSWGLIAEPSPNDFSVVPGLAFGSIQPCAFPFAANPSSRLARDFGSTHLSFSDHSKPPHWLSVWF